jgi:HTH-like domain
LTNTIVDIHRMSRRSYGSPRVHAELRLAQETFCSRKRVERLMRQADVRGSIGVAIEAARYVIHKPRLPKTS